MIHSRQEFAEYCLRNLGAPVVEINVDDDQLEDRLDEALEYWRMYHPEGIEKVYLKTLIRASEMTLIGAAASEFSVGEIIKGETSGATALVCAQYTGGEWIHSSGTDDDILYVRNIVGTFEADEPVTGQSTGLTGILGGLVLHEIDNKYLEVSDLVYGVSRVIPFAGTQTSKSMFDIQYQLRLNDLYDLTSTSIIYYKSVMSHLALLDMELNGKPMFRFNRLQNRINLDVNWGSDVVPGTYIVVEAYRALDPDVHSRLWNESWLKHYATALIKRQWGTNLKKFGNIQLPGGVVLDGQGMYQEAMQEIKDLEEELQTKAAPMEFFLG